MNARPCVEVTGLGIVSPFGTGVDRYWQGLLRGRRAPMTDREPGSGLPVSCVHMLEPQYGGVDDIYSVATRAMAEAIGDASLTREELAQAGLAIGTGMGMARHFEDIDVMASPNTTGLRPRPDWCSSGAIYALTTELARELGMCGPTWSVSTACSASLYALALAIEAIEHGETDVMLCMGIELHSLVALLSFNRLAGLDPAGCRAFSAARQGTFFGEGAAALVLQSSRRAQRHRVPHARIAGYSYNSDASHPTAPEPQGQQIGLMICDALQRSGLRPADIDAIVPHGTGTLLNDAMEVRVFQRVFGERAAKIPIYPVKTLIGHGGGAAGAFSAATSVLMLSNQRLPALDTADQPEFDMTFARTESLPATLRHVLTNAYAFGGNNASVIFAHGVSPMFEPVAVQRTVRVLSPEAARSDEWFDANRYLGTHGHRYLGQAARYFMAAVSQLREQAPILQGTHESVGMVVGTNYAARDIHETILRDFKRGGLGELSPRYVPNFSINLLAAYPSIKHGYSAFNITLTTHFSAGLDALIQAAWTLTERRAKAVIVGAAEAPEPEAGVRQHGAVASAIVASSAVEVAGSVPILLAAVRGMAAGMADLERFAERVHPLLAAFTEARSGIAVHCVAQTNDDAARMRELCARLSLPLERVRQFLLPQRSATLEPLQLLLELIETAALPAVTLIHGSCGVVHCFLTLPARQ